MNTDLKTSTQRSSAAADVALDAIALASVLELIFVAIVNDAGKHGDFLKAFARAYLRADPENRELLRPSAVALVEKYGLIKHLPA